MESSLIGPFELNKPAGEPMTVSVAAGIITKRVNSEPAESPFELKLNVTNTELVVVEDASQLDSNAVILKVRIYFDLFDFYCMFFYILEHSCPDL